MDTLVFVYGTLKQGFNNNSLLKNAEFVGEAITKDSFLMTTVGFPYLIPKDRVERTDVEFNPALGEVYLVKDDKTMQHLDWLEGVEVGHYEKQEVQVILLDETDEPVKALAYVPVNPDTQAYRVCETTELFGGDAYVFD